MRYGIYYQGRLAESRLTKKAAESRAYELLKVKGWLASDVEIKQIVQVGV